MEPSVKKIGVSLSRPEGLIKKKEEACKAGGDRRKEAGGKGIWRKPATRSRIETGPPERIVRRTGFEKKSLGVKKTFCPASFEKEPLPRGRKKKDIPLNGELQESLPVRGGRHVVISLKRKIPGTP